MRLDYFLHLAGFGSRKQVKMLIKRRAVTIDDEIIMDENRNCDCQLQKIAVFGEIIKGPSDDYFILNKPKGVVTAKKDEKYLTVFDCLLKKDITDQLYPVGRLDRDTEGLVLLTTNGPLGYKLLQPKNHVSKLYLVEVNGPLESDIVAFFKNGVQFHDGTVCKPAIISVISSSKEKSIAKLSISEGKFHQVKKMFLAYGVKVTKLKRISFAGISLGQLESGQYRTLTSKEKEIIKSFL
ncbi:pseudouridine synthase [Streptococcus urinalis FB127-CNA-2]|uniref:Pseudouridine synthase n=1 Tax=Streptococcus urinalis 2285-97 TaxID=764291 RepID=G5KDK9_9STRE|nr:pseudouridine synthase [Streptococcus urinalis]EHJ57346.1 pseudouridylate synthase [Streptococcus urinalis 2285-97]EKS19396.1 pseudouridine synthase [Streptococcus urinalis FB127-CNA-2]VEF31527.1 ribosomal small subunit pseudouridine synthase A [Streptococcus urinalis]